LTIAYEQLDRFLLALDESLGQVAREQGLR
jgi:hypothetical protein